jgi:hypothetical protein
MSFTLNSTLQAMRMRLEIQVIGLTALILFSLPVAGADIYLEGISMLGAKKKAFLSVDGEKLSVEAGESIDEDWQIERIEQRSIWLRGKGENAELRELSLHSSLGEGAKEPMVVTTPANNPFSSPSKIPPNQEQPVFQPRRIDPKDVPAGHHVMSTPFGDVLVKDQPVASELSPSSVQLAPNPVPKAPSPGSTAPTK